MNQMKVILILGVLLLSINPVQAYSSSSGGWTLPWISTDLANSTIYGVLLGQYINSTVSNNTKYVGGVYPTIQSAINDGAGLIIANGAISETNIQIVNNTHIDCQGNGTITASASANPLFTTAGIGYYSNWSIKNCKLIMPTTTQYIISVGGNHTDYEISGNIFHGNSSFAIELNHFWGATNINASNNGTISKNMIYGALGGIAVNGDDNIISENRIYLNPLSGSGGNEGIDINSGNTVDGYRNRVYGNEIVGYTTECIDSTGLTLNTYDTVYDNYCEGASQAATMGIVAGYGTTIYNNEIHNSNIGIRFWNDSKIFRNTISNTVYGLQGMSVGTDVVIHGTTFDTVTYKYNSLGIYTSIFDSFDAASKNTLGQYGYQSTYLIDGTQGGFARLTLNGSSPSGDVNQIELNYNGTNQAYITSRSNGNLAFYVNGSDRLIIQPNGTIIANGSNLLQTAIEEEFTGDGSRTYFNTTYSPIVTNSTKVTNSTQRVRYGAGAGKYTANSTGVIFGTAPVNGESVLIDYVV